jgi:hypothetical protein
MEKGIVAIPAERSPTMGRWMPTLRAWAKGHKVKRLAMAIAPRPEQRFHQVLDAINEGLTGNSQRTRAIEEFLDMCTGDEGVAKAMHAYRLSRRKLWATYDRLVAAGLDRWVRGSHVALFSLAYLEPLVYLLESEKQGRPMEQIAADLVGYWNGEIAEGGLFEKI